MASARFTVVDLRRIMDQRYIPMLQSIGYPVDGIKLERLTGHYSLTDKDGFGAPGVVGAGLARGYIGRTAAEACQTIITITRAMEFATTWSIENHERVTR